MSGVGSNERNGKPGVSSGQRGWKGAGSEYAGIRGQLAEINQRLSDLNGKYNAERVELGDVAQDKIDAAGIVRKETIAAARQEYIETRRSESAKYQEVFKAVTGPATRGLQRRRG